MTCSLHLSSRFLSQFLPFLFCSSILSSPWGGHVFGSSHAVDVRISVD
jgi:hypothetical protein